MASNNETPVHHIYFPPGGTAPNVPADMQKQAETTEAALQSISEAPVIICEQKAIQPSPAAASTFFAVKWDVESWKQGIGHDIKQDQDIFYILEDGLYSITAKVAWGDGDVTAATIINVNGVDRIPSRFDVSGTVRAYPKPTTTYETPLFAGDVVRIRSSGTKGSVDLSPTECYLSIKKTAGFAKAN